MTTRESRRLGSIPRYPEWKRCREGHSDKRTRPPKASVHRGFIIHRWLPDVFCVTPFIDNAGSVIPLDQEQYPNKHEVEIEGMNVHTNCHSFGRYERYGHHAAVRGMRKQESEEQLIARAVAFIELQWASWDEAVS